MCILGEHVKTQKLDYEPLESNKAISPCGPNLVVVLEYDPNEAGDLFIHHLPDGEALRRISRGQLGLGGLRMILGVHYSDPGFIHVAAGSGRRTHTLRLYKVPKNYYYYYYYYALLYYEMTVSV